MKEFSNKLQSIISISGLPGLYKAVTNRANGLIVEDLSTGKTSFISARKHNFTPLETIALYTIDGTEELIHVFETMKEKVAEFPLPEAKADKMAYMQYFDNILPDYDEDRVHIRDMKKVVKWYKQVDGLGMLDEKEENVKADKEEKKIKGDEEE